MTETLLTVENLHTQFDTDDGVVRAVDGVDFTVERGETVCIVGESGSGKTVASESITKLIRMPPGEIPEGTVRFKGRDLTAMDENELREVRGSEIGHVFQNPQGALNPVYTVGWQLVEAIQLHRDVPREEARETATQLLDRVGIPDATSRVDDYPHEFSGGMKQRIVIAMALAPNPDLLIADEPTTALDVTIQAQILDLLRELQAEFDMGILLITHDLGVVAELADRVVVMYAGKVMETADVYDLFERPSHPYTRALLDCLPGRGGDTRSIEGSLPDPTDPPDGCRFADRCRFAIEDCRGSGQPPMYPVGDDADHTVSCVHFAPGADPSVVLEDRPPAEGGTGGTGTVGGSTIVGEGSTTAGEGSTTAGEGSTTAGEGSTTAGNGVDAGGDR